METVIISILAVYFGIGAIAVYAIGRKHPGTAKGGWTKYVVYLLIVVTVFILMAWKTAFLGLFGLILMISLAELVRAWQLNPSRKISVLIPALLIFGTLAFGFQQFVLHSELNELRFVYLLVFTFDGFAQITGQLFGKRLLVPQISPGKTVEGMIGGFSFALFTALLMIPYLDRSAGELLAISLIVAAAAFAGDLLASLYKRMNHLKDFGSLLPGHGGILDRFDSFITAGAVFSAMLMYQH